MATPCHTNESVECIKRCPTRIFVSDYSKSEVYWRFKSCFVDDHYQYSTPQTKPGIPLHLL